MPNPINITNIPPPRVDFIDPRTGLIAREWYRFLFNQFKLTGSGTNETSLTDLQIGPPPINSVLGEINTSFDQSQIAAMSDQAEVVLGQLGLVYDQAQLASMIAQYEQATLNLQNQFDTAPAAPQMGTIASYNLNGSPTAGGVGYGTGSAVAFTPAGTSGQFLTSAAAGVPTWSSPASVAVTSFSAGTTGLTPSTATTGAVTLAGTLAVANGGTGVTTSTGSGSVVLSTSPTLVTPTLGAASGTSLSLSGDLTFSATAQRILGDFTTATIANRPLFQTSVANSATTIGVIPSGTAINATISLESAESATNCSAGQLGVVGGTDVRITSLARGTGTVLPIAFWIGGSERMRIDSAGNVGIGTASPAQVLDVVGGIRSTSGANNINLRHDGTNGSIINNGGSFLLYAQGVQSMLFHTNSVERMRITSTGSVGIGTGTPSANLEVNRGSEGEYLRVGGDNALNGRSLRFTSSTNDGSNGALHTINAASASGVIAFATGGTERMRVTNTGTVGIGTTTNLSTLTVNGSFASKSPSTVNAATYTVAATDGSLRFTTTNNTLTLPAAASFPGRILYLNTITANSVTSAAANVIPLGSNTAGTAILAATAGKFAMLQSDGTNWITMLAN